MEVDIESGADGETDADPRSVLLKVGRADKTGHQHIQEDYSLPLSINKMCLDHLELAHAISTAYLYVLVLGHTLILKPGETPLQTVPESDVRGTS
jgi:hypothetical protein